MRLNAVLNLQFDIPAVTGDTDADEEAAVLAVCAALADLDLAELVSVATPEYEDTEVSYTINLDGSPVEHPAETREIAEGRVPIFTDAPYIR